MGFFDIMQHFKKLDLRVAEQEITFAELTTGEIASKEIFTVTGQVIAAVYGVCSVDLGSGTGTIALGVAGSTALYIAATTATTIDAGEVWTDGTPAAAKLYSTLVYAILNESDIGYTVATDTIDSGTIKFYCAWIPISADGRVEAAGSNIAL